MVNKQKMVQKIDLEYYNIDFMGKALSMAKIYAFRFGEQNKRKIFIRCSDIIADLFQSIKKIRMNYLRV